MNRAQLNHANAIRSRYFAILVALSSCNFSSAFGSEKTEVLSSSLPPTFSKDIAAIVYQRCTACHREGQSGPFELKTYEDVSKRADTISAVVKNGYMPPWKPVHSTIEFSNDRRLTTREQDLIQRWIEADCPMGSPGEMPPMPDFPVGWSLGKPDLVIQLEKPFEIPADGPDIYRSFVFPVELPEDRWIKAIELRPTARSAVHHALFFIDPDAVAKNQSGKDGKPGFRGMNFLRGKDSWLESTPSRLMMGLGGYVPGATPNRLPSDLARFLPSGSDIVMQTHFHPTGKKQTEQAELALYFASSPPKQKLVMIQLPPLFGMGAGIDIPAGEADYTVTDSYKLPIDVKAFEVGGHAHYICRSMNMKATLPSGDSLDLLKINDWDLDWQDQYQFDTPVDLPSGTELQVTITYDNSSQNPENPFSPPRQISWGRESTDEMGSISLTVIAKDEDQRTRLEKDLQTQARESIRKRIQSQVPKLGGARGNFGDGRLLKMLDRNGDGNLQASEIPEKQRERVLDLMDSNNDGTIDAKEQESGRKALQRFMENKRSNK